MHSPESAVSYDSADLISGVPTVAVVDDESFGLSHEEEVGWGDLYAN
jgi:hypothetical protein